MKEIILIKTGEIALKGLNKSSFEDVLVKNIKWRLHSLGPFKFLKAQSTIYLSRIHILKRAKGLLRRKKLFCKMK